MDTVRTSAPPESVPVTAARRRAVDRDDIRGRLADRLRLDATALTEEVTLEQLGLDSLLLTETLADVEEQYDVVLHTPVIAMNLVPGLPLGALLDLLADEANAARSREAETTTDPRGEV
ncbi:acyl carrier protein [Streptomyces lavendulae]|uniref:acyl carrier protein n=1 Tax=Streptomyces lavendulae TaxID=1914 RepID=UPI0031ECE1AD